MNALVKIRRVISFKFFRPIVYTVVMGILLASSLLPLHSLPLVIMSTDFLIKFQILTYFSLGISISISLCYFAGYSHPKNSVKRAVFQSISPVLILVDILGWSSLNALQIKVGGVGEIHLDTTPLFLVVIIIVSIGVLTKLIDVLLCRKRMVGSTQKE